MPLQNICCTCLSTDRKLSQLNRVENGIMDLFCLLLNKTEANEARIKDVTQLLVCWECCALLQRFSRFREQTSIAQRQLTDVAEGKISNSDLRCLSKLSHIRENWSNQELGVKSEVPEEKTTPKLLVNRGIVARNFKMEIEADKAFIQLDDMKRSLDEEENKYDGKNGERKEKDIERFNKGNKIIDDKLSPIDNMNGGNVKIVQENNLNENKDAMTVDIPSNEINYSYDSTESSDTDDSCDDKDLEENGKDKNKNFVWSVNIPIANNEDNGCSNSTDISEGDYINDIINEKDGKSKGEAKIKNEVEFVSLSVVKDEKSDYDCYSTDDKSKAFQGNVESKKRIEENNFMKPFVKYNAISTIEVMANGNKLRKVIIPVKCSREKSNTLNDKFIRSNSIQNLENKSTNSNRNKNLNPCYDIIKITMEQLLHSIKESRAADAFVSAVHKCEQCVEIFDSSEQLDRHRQLHEPKPYHVECGVCHVFVPLGSTRGHRARHLLALRCRVCARVLRGATARTSDAARHLRAKHYMQASYVDEQMSSTEAMIKIYEYHSPKAEEESFMRLYSSLDKVVKIALESKKPSPDMTKQKSSPDMTKQNSSPDMTKQKLSPDMTKQKSSPDITKQNSSPDMTKQKPSPDMTKQKSSPDMTKQNSSPDMTKQKYSPDMTKQNSSPDMTKQKPSPDMTKQKSSPVLGKKLKIIIDDPKGRGYACIDCNKYFKSKNVRNNHLQRFHGEGFQCASCGKKFLSSTALNRHEKSLCNPLPYAPCAQCGKAVRADVAAAHARSHAAGERAACYCAPCDKRFTLPAQLAVHMKYHRAHAGPQPKRIKMTRYKCSACDKEFRTTSDLSDHYNFQHLHQTQHCCPICRKAVATKRSIARHIKRAHQGIKNDKRDKICQTCGKAFTTSQMLQEHELTHTGEKPLSCDMCGRSFRQKACLYTHKRLVHKVALKKKPVLISEAAAVNSEINKNDN